MARVTLSEFRAKTLVFEALGLDYSGCQIDTVQPVDQQIEILARDGHFVVKVDQAVKKRMKQGLILLDQSFDQLPSAIEQLAGKGYRYLLVEPFQAHAEGSEHYLSLELTREGTKVAYSLSGGIDVEEANDVQHVLADPDGLGAVSEALKLSIDQLQKLVDLFETTYACLLEINPLVVNNDQLMPLDVALQVDGEAAHLAHHFWSADDVRVYRRQTPEEVAIAELAATSRASLRYEVINPNGSVFLLLSGGGASIVVADEVNNRGFGQSLGNYGEYSGNPSAAETQVYTHQLLTTLLNSTAPKKVLVIAGAVANFTDVRSTFSGVIKAIDELAEPLRNQGVTVYVRRGGPHQAEGLAAMERCLEKNGLLGEVHGPDLPLAESVSAALALLESA
ncbi:MAG TPA: ATP citrate lyase citrate-binding domain-containing protein [Candidatus Saccharimonadales bacterium]|nr:ATP citrate lyase citrate-binding domain-containing protein [Candidatus Saccharimonadales bacterium]